MRQKTVKWLISPLICGPVVATAFSTAMGVIYWHHCQRKKGVSSNMFSHSEETCYYQVYISLGLKQLILSLQIKAFSYLQIQELVLDAGVSICAALHLKRHIWATSITQTQGIRQQTE
uniref:Putative secreted protein n=1 Tax=Ixodes ricinus TaxID=34613 RepID=A0A6B0UMF6_IXORI